ncbi:putative transcription factor WD40-like family [Helianthus debilis subsp. tardiflorus]
MLLIMHLNICFQFDYLKSLEIEEKINKIRWCQTANGALFLLSTNDKTIKFWKVQEKKVKKVAEMNMDSLKAVGNGSIANSSVSLINKSSHATNGECPDKPYTSLNKDFSSSGAIQSLRLPVVVVLNLCFI